MHNLIKKIVAILWGSSAHLMGYSTWADIYSESRKKNLQRLNSFNARLGLDSKLEAKIGYSLSDILFDLAQKLKLLCLFFNFAKGRLPSAKLLILMEWGRYGQIENFKQLRKFLRSVNHPRCSTDIYYDSDVVIFDPVLSSKANKSGEVNVFDLGDVYVSFGLRDKMGIISLFFSLLLTCKISYSGNIFRSAMAIATAKFIAKQIAPRMLIMTTSNSYMSEGLRFELLWNSSEVNVVEILHGIPTLEIDEYHQELSKVLGEVTHNFIPKLNSLKMDQIYKCDDVSAINLTTLMNNPACQKLNKDDKFLYVGLGGGTANCKNYLESKIFQLEMSLFEVVDKWALKNQVLIKRLYTFHPYRRTKNNIEYLKNNHPNIMLLDSSVELWEVADIFLTVYSSSIWEAERYGAKVWFPIKKSDELFSDLLLGERGMAESENDMEKSLMNFLDNFAKEVIQ